MNRAKIEALQNALVAILEDLTEQGGEDCSLANLTEHHASLFGVSASDLEHEVELYEIASLVRAVRAGEISGRDQAHDLRRMLVRDAMLEEA
jgi:hypothetical protein